MRTMIPIKQATVFRISPDNVDRDKTGISFDSWVDNYLSTLVVLLIAVGITSVTNIGGYALVPVTAVLDAWLVGLIILLGFRGKLRTSFVLGFYATYLVAVLAIGVYTKSPILDLLQAYKWVVYIVIMSLLYSHKYDLRRRIVILAWALSSLALLKALLTLLVLGDTKRPGLFLENNFEIPLFVGLVALAIFFKCRRRLLLLSLLGIVVLLASSRSGSVVYLLLIFYYVTQLKNLNIFVRYLALVISPLGALIPVAIFVERAQMTAVRLDRLNFIEVFLRESAFWDSSRWLFGTVPITPLNPESCATLSYYSSLFSSTADGSCYSVILHAFILRVVYDAGLVGLLLSIYGPFRVLTRSNTPISLTIFLISVSILNGLSVSGFNNPYVVLPILFAALANKRTRAPDNHL